MLTDSFARCAAETAASAAVSNQDAVSQTRSNPGVFDRHRQGVRRPPPVAHRKGETLSPSRYGYPNDILQIPVPSPKSKNHLPVTTQLVQPPPRPRRTWNDARNKWTPRKTS